MASVGRPGLIDLQARVLSTFVVGRGGWEAVVVTDVPRPDWLDVSSPIAWIETPPAPANDLRNAGARAASSEYLIFLDDDDFLYANWATEFETLARSSADLLCIEADAVHERILKGDATVDRSLRRRGLRKTTDDFGIAGTTQLAGAFAVRRTRYESAGGYRDGLSSLQHTEFFLRLIKNEPPLSVASSDRVGLVVGERRDGLRHNADLARRRVESAKVILEQNGLAHRSTPEVASFLDATGFYAHVAGVRRDAIRFGWAALRIRPTPKRLGRLVRSLRRMSAVSPQPQAPSVHPPVSAHQEPRVSVVIPSRLRDQAWLTELCRFFAAVPAVREVIVSVDGADCPDVVEEIAESAIVIRRPNSGGPAAARNSGLDRAISDFVLFFDDDDVPIPGGFLLLGGAVTGGDEVAQRAFSALQIFDSGVRAPAIVDGLDSALSLTSSVQMNTTVWPSRSARQIRFDESLRGSEDRDFIVRSLRAGLVCEFVPFPVSRHTPAGWGNASRKTTAIDGFERILRRYQEQGLLGPTQQQLWLTRLSALRLRSGQYAQAASHRVSAVRVAPSLPDVALAVGFIFKCGIRSLRSRMRPRGGPEQSIVTYSEQAEEAPGTASP